MQQYSSTSVMLSRSEVCMQVRCGIDPFPLHIDPRGSLSKQLDAAAAQAAQSGRRMSGIILTNPNNPTGEVMPLPVLREYLAWCCANSVHVIRRAPAALTHPANARQSSHALGRPGVMLRMMPSCGRKNARGCVPATNTSAICLLRSDEIYANSIFKQGAGFVSMATVLAQSPPELLRVGAALVHTVFGLSKDWWVVLSSICMRMRP